MIGLMKEIKRDYTVDNRNFKKQLRIEAIADVISNGKQSKVVWTYYMDCVTGYKSSNIEENSQE